MPVGIDGGRVQVRRGSRVSDRGHSGERRKVLRAGLAHNGASRHEVLEELFDVLVVDIQLFFEGVQFGIVEDLPPFAAQLGIRGLRDRPVSSILELSG